MPATGFLRSSGTATPRGSQSVTMDRLLSLWPLFHHISHNAPTIRLARSVPSACPPLLTVLGAPLGLPPQLLVQTAAGSQETCGWHRSQLARVPAQVLLCRVCAAASTLSRYTPP